MAERSRTERLVRRLQELQMSTPDVEATAVVSVDGQDPEHLSNGDEVKVTAHKKSLYMVRFEDPFYFYRNLISYMEHNPITSIKSNEQPI